MSLSLDKLRLLRRQAGDATPAPAREPALRPEGASVAAAGDTSAAGDAACAALPAAANDARARRPAPASVFGWVEQEIRHKPTGAAAGAHPIVNVVLYLASPTSCLTGYV